MREANEPCAVSNYPEFCPGQRVRDRHGIEHEVMRQEGCRVFMRDCGGWWHPTKVLPVGGGPR